MDSKKKTLCGYARMARSTKHTALCHDFCAGLT